VTNETSEMVPPLVQVLAEKEGKIPIGWFVAEDHVTIVYASGQKVIYDRAPKANIQPAQIRTPIIEPVNRPPTSSRSRSSRKK
jgi:hypothetical protein